MTFCAQPEFSVTTLSQLLKKTVETSFRNLQVRGEISSPKRHTSGHLYFTLRDDNTTLDAVCWRPTATRFSHLFEDGAEVLCQGRLTIYPLRSKYQLVVESLALTGEGALLKLFEQRKIKLQAEGLFKSEAKKKIPSFPRVIGIITSPTGAVIRDILHRLQDRLPRHVYLWPVNVQGSGAAEEIAQAIVGMNNWNDAWGPIPPDVLIVARGGGSLEDLAAFNEEVVVRATYASRIPLISAIGHETDITLIDYVADLRAPTPTAAAEFAVPVRENLLTNLQNRANQQRNHLYRLLEHADLRLKVTVQKLLPQGLSTLQTGEQRFDEIHDRLLKSMDPFLLARRQRIQILAASLRTPEWVFQCSHLTLQRAIQNLHRAFSQYVTQKTQATYHYTQLLESLSYHKTLERGFCVIKSSEGQFLTSAHQAQPNTPIQLNFHDGMVEGVTR